VDGAVSGRLESEWSPIPYRLALTRRKFKALDKNKGRFRCVDCTEAPFVRCRLLASRLDQWMPELTLVALVVVLLAAGK
jgi:hypothetical protein